MAYIEELSCFWHNLMIVLISRSVIFAMTGYDANAQSVNFYGNTTMPATITFNNTGVFTKSIRFKNEIIWYYPPEVIADEYRNRLSYNTTISTISMTIDNITQEDAGVYTLNNEDDISKPILFDIQLYIMGRPLTPNITIVRNGTVGAETGLIKCEATSTTKPSGLNFTYNWRRNSRIIGIGLGGFTLAISVYRNETLNNYTCSATEVYGLTSAISNYVTLQPDRSPLVCMKPESSLYKEIEFKQIYIECVVMDGKPTNYMYRWWMNGTALPNISSSFFIKNVSRSDTGKYKCSVDNGVEPNGEGETQLDILYGPVINGNTMISQEDGHSLTIACQVESNPKPLDANMTWARPQNNTFSDKGLKVEIPNVNRKDNGTFLCSVNLHFQPTKGSHEIKSASGRIYVNVLYGPTITPIRNQSIEEGKNTTIICYIESNPSATNRNVIWKKEKNSSFSETGLELSFKNLNRVDQGTFVCSANITLYPTEGNTVDRLAEANAHITVLYGPSISKMGTYSQEEGRNLTIICRIQANPTATNNDVTWTKQGSSSFSQTGLQLFLPFVNREDQGTFVCYVSILLQPTGGPNVFRNNSETVEINILYGPIISPMSNKSFVEGQNITLKCQVQSNPEVTDHNVTWVKQGNTSFLSKGLHLHIPALNRIDNGIFVCKVEMKLEPTDGKLVFRNSTETLTINVQYQPNITHIGVNTYVIFEGNITTAVCQANGNPIPTVSWVYLENNTSINSSLSSDLFWNNVSSQLTLNSAKCEDTGTYMCLANNGIMSSNNRSIQINVNCKPRISSTVNENRNITVGRNESLVYTLMFYAFPKPVFKWTFNHTELIGFNVTDTKHRLPYQSGSTIQKAEITDADIGLYEVIAENQFGQDKSSFYIIFQREPDPPLLLSFSCTERPESVKIEWTAGQNGGLDQRFIIQYKKETGDNFKDAEKEIAEDHTIEVYSEFIDHLLAGLTYIFRVKALNPKGRSVSVEVNCTVEGISEPNNSSAVTIIVVVSIICVLSLLGGVGGLQLFKRRKSKKNKKQLIAKTSPDNTANIDEDELKENPLYMSSGPMNSGNEAGAIYSVVEKPKKKRQSKETIKNSQQAVYAEVVKSNKKEKKDKAFEMGCVYENSKHLNRITEGDEHANSNTNEQIQSRNINKPIKNTDGLIYADLDLTPGPSGHRFVIRGIENRNNYAIIDLAKKAEPLPSDSESENEIASTD